jgi:putative ABC transport system permease protein
MAIPNLAVRSLYNRRYTAALTVCAIAISVSLLVGVEKIRREAKASFTNTISGTDLIVGARSGALPLLLYSVFRIGSATNNIDWSSYEWIKSNPSVSWTIPISLGDSHRGYRVVGTNTSYFEHYRYGRKQALRFAEGNPFEGLYETVLGAEVAEALGYRLDDAIVIAHGAGAVSFVEHSDKPFTVVGILERTGTPVDRSVHVSLEAITAIHIDWQGGAPVPSKQLSAEQTLAMDLTPKAITAILVGLESKIATFGVQRTINENRREPLLAIIPGVALQELWKLMGVAETALLAVSVFVVVSSLIGLMTVVLAGLNERRREMAILRSVGARPAHVFGLLIAEAGLLAACGVVLGLALYYAALLIARPWVETQFGLHIPVTAPNAVDLTLLAAVFVAAVLVAAVPAWRAYRYSLADGMTLRL